MTLQEALAFIAVYMEKNAKVVAEQMVKDGLVARYAAKTHAAAAGRVLAHVMQEGVEPNAINMTVLFHSLANHSAWRQKFEGKGIFPKAVTEGETVANPAKAQDKLAKLMAEFESKGGAEV